MLHTGLKLLHSPQQVNAIKCQIVKKKKRKKKKNPAHSPKLHYFSQSLYNRLLSK